MKNIKSIIAAASLIAQATFFVGFVFLLVDLFNLTNIITPDMEEDSSLLVPYILETIASYQPLLGIGVIGAIVSYVIYFKKILRAPWYLTGTRVVGWLWLPVVPIGTVIGIVLLGARKAAIETRSDA
ncbi:MAG: hypothetical protein ACR2QX_13330 [Woeseiaceae bacterium]